MTSHGIIEALVRHQLFIQRYGGSAVKRSLPILRQLARDLRDRIEGGGLTEFQAGRAARLESDIRTLIATAAADIEGLLEIDEFAQHEVDFSTKVLNAAVAVDLAPTISPGQLRAVTTRSLMTLVSGDNVKRLTLRQAFDEFAEGVGRDALRVVQAGVLEGKTQQQMARGVSELIATRSRQQAESLIRTATNHIGSIARNTVYQANADILEGERWISTLDGRTTLVCAGRDGEIHPLGQGPRPPAHFGCRSIMVPVVKEQYRIETLGQRASMDGPVDNRTTYGGFLRRQSKEFQDDMLGPRRAKLFRSGKVSIDRFTDDLGRTLTLDELRAREGLTLAA
ncbi:MAG: minor capsid protein [Alcanivorax jadensis]|uniref:minor capsid protein n=1 Tax=Alcanivorax jadensis TaxID=64988 RepID=UPI0030029A99